MRRTAEQIAELLRGRIEHGLLIPGQRLSQRDVAELFATSTTPVREAFQILVAQGFLRIDHNRGAVVERPTPAEVREIYEIRKALEALAVRAALPNLRPADYQRLEGLTRQMRDDPDSAARVAHNREFHSLLYAAAGMPRLAELIAQLRSAVSYYVDRAYQASEVTAQAIAEHEAVLNACRRGDADAAAAAIASHLESSAVAAVDSAARLELLGAVGL